MDSVLSPVPKVPPEGFQKADKRRKRPRKSKKVNGKMLIREQTSVYDVVDSLGSAQSGLTFGQIMRGDAKITDKELRRPFSPLNGQGTKGTSKTNPALVKQVYRVLKVVPVKIYGFEAFAL